MTDFNENLQINIKSHFLDSGAFSLHRKSFIQKGIKMRGEDFFDSAEFWKYIDSYAKFIKKYKIAIDLYANLDVIGNPKLTWRNQKYLENKHKLSPIPIIHFGTDLKWLKRYINEGYQMVGVGGLVGNARNKYCIQWIDKYFNIVCASSNNLPKIKIHGFGIMGTILISKYPWWSVDATNAEKLARYGKIIIPRKVKNLYDYKKEAYIVALSKRVKTHLFNIHYKSIAPLRKKIVKDWLDFINQSKRFNKPLKFETNNEYKAANFFYYEELLKTIPKWPWPFKSKKRKPLI